MRYLTSDHHFNHEKIITYCDRNFSTVEEMNEHMIEMWNFIVKPGDVVYHLGDFIFGNKEECKRITSRLNGTKILIKGNHDGNNKFYLDCGFKLVLPGTALVKYRGIRFVLSHMPIIGCKHFNIHGHIHNTPTELKNGYNHRINFNVGVDVNEYKPFSFDEVHERAKNFAITTRKGKRKQANAV